MNQYEEKLKKFIKEHRIDLEYFRFNESCHSVEDAAKATNTDVTHFVKNVCMIDSGGNLIVAIVPGDGRASTKRISKALNIDAPRVATPKEVLDKTGFECGGTPSFGYKAVFLMDPKVMEREWIWTGGGSEYSLVKLSPRYLQKINNATIVRVRK